MDKIEYQNTDTFCKKILADFDAFADMLEWLNKYEQVYKKINIQPKGLPAIASCNYEGVSYEQIAKFHSLYQKTEYEYHILEYLPHDLAIMYFFEHMNAYMLGHYLKEEYYMGKDRLDFLNLISLSFKELQNRGNTQLIAQDIYCQKHDLMEYCFMGNNDKSYLHLILKLDNKTVVNLMEGIELDPNLPIDINPEKRVYI